MIVLYVVGGLAVGLLVLYVALRIAVLVVVEQILERHTAWKAAHPNATPDEEHEFWRNGCREPDRGGV